MALFRKSKIQAMGEGSKDNVNIENLLTATRVNGAIGGVCNEYKTYGAQTRALYRKYNAEDDFGNQQTRAVLDLRSSFIAGEALSISINNEDDAFEKWVSDFLNSNKLFGSRFYDLVLGTEMTGKALLTLGVKPGEMPKALRVPYTPACMYRCKLANMYDPDSIIDIYVKKNGQEKSLGLSNFVYIRTGGDDCDVNKTTTKTGVVLTDIENYDRAAKDIRRTNYTTSRITPTFKTKDEKETNKLVKFLETAKWKIGQAFIGTADFNYKAPQAGSLDGQLKEMSTSIKTIAGVTGAPVHWIGWVDLMSNRSTAETLYDTLGNATIRERTLIAEGIHELIIKAQELYINAGGEDIRTVNKDFEVKIPVVDFSKFLDMVRGLSLAFNDGVISKNDYQSQMPGINPLETEKALEMEQKQAEDDLMSRANLNNEEDIEDV